jgi:hypothetical protein
MRTEHSVFQGEEILYLPTIVEAAESSPSAAKEAASVIRKFLSKDNYGRPHVQYNGLMLVRILVDNPGRTFTRNLDAKFVGTVRDLLRQGRDLSVQQILRESLDAFEKDRKDDGNLAPLLEMWAKEKKAMEKIYSGRVSSVYQPTRYRLPDLCQLTGPATARGTYYARDAQCTTIRPTVSCPAELLLTKP